MTKGKDHLHDWMLCFAHPYKQFFTWEFNLAKDDGYGVSVCEALWNLSQIEVEREIKGCFTPLLFFAQQAQVPCELCTVDWRGGGPGSGRCLWLCLVQRCRGCVACETCIHYPIAEPGWIELERLSSHESNGDKKKERDSTRMRSRISTDEGI